MSGRPWQRSGHDVCPIGAQGAPVVRVPDAETPRGVRLYVIGDVHGCLGKLEEVNVQIEDDLNARPPDDWRIVYLGDFVDRGPESRGVIDFVIGQMAARRVYALRGNHDQFMIDFLGERDPTAFQIWVSNGGIQTLASYGIAPDRIARAGDTAGLAKLHEAFLDALPEGHGPFLAGLPHMVRLGDYAFVHAGVRPGVPLKSQRSDDLLWIREPFLSSDEDFGAVVVHGHTVEDQVRLRPNRIGVDTGAVFGGPLSCLVLEGTEAGLLGAQGPVPLALPASRLPGPEAHAPAKRGITRLFGARHSRGKGGGEA